LIKKLHYQKIGSGKKVLLAFHGFGQDSSAFSLFEESLGREYTIYSFDIFFHGESKWPEDELPVSISEWEQMFIGVLQKEKISTFTLLGYSLGGKIALATAALLPEQTEGLILIAPDGVKLHPWYRIATGTWLMRSVFYFLSHRPAQLLVLIALISRFRLISKKLAKFAASQVGDPDNGRRIYFSWVGFRHFTYKRSELISMLNRHGMHVTVVAGKYDSVIPGKHLKYFASQCQHHSWILIKTGHKSLLREYHALLLAQSGS